jgi:hypothetical protein
MRVESSKVKAYLSFNLEGTLLEPLLLRLMLTILNCYVNNLNSY